MFAKKICYSAEIVLQWKKGVPFSVWEMYLLYLFSRGHAQLTWNGQTYYAQFKYVLNSVIFLYWAKEVQVIIFNTHFHAVCYLIELWCCVAYS